MSAFALPSDLVAGEVVDDELIIMNLGAGTYYSAPGSGRFIWNALVSGVDMDAAIAALAERAEDAATFAAGARSMIAMLREGGVIVPLDQAQPFDRDALLAAVDAERLTPPMIEVHRDMADILMLDPIHDVGQAGWPVRPGAN